MRERTRERRNSNIITSRYIYTKVIWHAMSHHVSTFHRFAVVDAILILRCHTVLTAIYVLASHARTVRDCPNATFAHVQISNALTSAYVARFASSFPAPFLAENAHVVVVNVQT